MLCLHVCAASADFYRQQSEPELLLTAPDLCYLDSTPEVRCCYLGGQAKHVQVRLLHPNLSVSKTKS